MRHSVIFLLTFISAIHAAAIVPPDSAEAVHFDKPLLTLFHHIRFGQLNKHDNKAALYWNMSDSANHIRAEFIIPRTAESIDYAEVVTVSVIRRTAGRDSLLSRTTLDIKTSSASGDGLSAILSLQRNGRASLSLGGSKASPAIEVPFDSENPGATAFGTVFPTKILDNFLLTQYREPKRMATFSNPDSLKNTIRTSKDRFEGIWTYLDRNTEQELASVSRAYILATISDGNGGYDIIYLGGNSKGWEPLQIKGRLKKTIFTDHFDLEWTAVDGSMLKDDTSATVEGAGNILRFDFPLLKSSVRFRKVPASAL